MAKGSSPKNSGNTKKTAWKGISIRNKSSSRPASVTSSQSQESRLSLVPSENESIAEAKVAQQPTEVKSTDNPSSGVTEKVGGAEGVDDDATSTPKARSRASSTTGIDSASEIFEDAYDDEGDVFDSDIPDALPTTLNKKEVKAEEPDLVAEIEALEVRSKPEEKSTPSTNANGEKKIEPMQTKPLNNGTEEPKEDVLDTSNISLVETTVKKTVSVETIETPSEENLEIVTSKTHEEIIEQTHDSNSDTPPERLLGMENHSPKSEKRNLPIMESGETEVTMEEETKTVPARMLYEENIPKEMETEDMADMKKIEKQEIISDEVVDVQATVKETSAVKSNEKVEEDIKNVSVEDIQGKTATTEKVLNTESVDERQKEDNKVTGLDNVDQKKATAEKAFDTKNSEEDASTKVLTMGTSDSKAYSPVRDIEKTIATEDIDREKSLQTNEMDLFDVPTTPADNLSTDNGDYAVQKLEGITSEGEGERIIEHEKRASDIMLHTVEVHDNTDNGASAVNDLHACSTDDEQGKDIISPDSDVKIESKDSGIFVNPQSTSSEEIAENHESSDDKTTSNNLDCLGEILPAIKDSAREIDCSKENMDKPDNERITSEDHERACRSREFEYSIEDPVDLDVFRDNVIAIQMVDAKNVPPNHLGPREQEEADEPIREGMRYLFDNKFMKAKAVFQTKASTDPLYALGLGSMAFIKAMMTYHEQDIQIAMDALATAYTIAKSQIDNTSFKKPFKDSFTQYFASFLSVNNTGLPSNPPVATCNNNGSDTGEAPIFTPNGVLRAHVIKAECCLSMGVLQMTQEGVTGYLKCGLNLRRAYNSYSIVWQEYKRMGQEFTKYMDRDTVSAIQFGIGAVHLLLSSMPAKILKIFSVLGWKSDKQLAFALLKLSLEGRGIRSPLASLTLLGYYSILTSFAPQIYTKELMGPAIECLLDAQKNHPNSCFFLFFAARIARVARNIPLSIQSFNYAADSSRGEWAEAAMKQMADYEIGFNYALQLDWAGAAANFEELSSEKYWSPAFSKYFVGACREMLGQRTEGILAFAEVPQLAKEQPGRKTYIDTYVQRKVEFFQRSGYQDMDFSLPGLELLLVWNAFEQMEEDVLEKCLDMIQRTLEMIYEREKVEYNIRLRELVPTTNPPDYYDQRAVLLLTKAAVLNALRRHNECIAHLNWILDHTHCIKYESWVVPFAYWESGVTAWGLGNYRKSRKLWQLALSCTKYDFEYRMAVRLSLALNKCDEVGIPQIDLSDGKGHTTHGRKRMPIAH